VSANSCCGETTLSQSQRRPNATGPGARPTVCVVDDDTALLRALKHLLGAAGFTVEVFESAESFLQAQQLPPPDCLVLDVDLHTMSGFDLHARLLASGTSVPTIFITGHDDDATREAARRAGAADYLVKPFGDQAIVSAIENALGRG
jgi:FixJ family two-component response regulator